MTLDVTKLTCVRGGREIFSGLEFALRPGEVLIVKGPNGSGKSSLLRLIAGFLRPASGAVLWDGEAIADDPESHGARTSYVGHLDAVKPVMTVEENLAFWAGMIWVGKGGRQAVEGRVKAGLDRLGLAAQSDLPAGYLSAGQRRRLNLARLIARPTALWLLDEPTAAMDDRSVEIVSGMIGEHCSGGGMAIVATHLELGLAGMQELNLADRQSRAGLELVP